MQETFIVTHAGLLAPSGGSDDPISHFRAALLVTAMTFIAVSLPFLLTYPLPLHQVPMSLSESWWDLRAISPYHRLEIASDGGIILDGRPRSDLVNLRVGLEIISLDHTAGVELRPHPELRYERFLEILAVAERAGLAHLRVTGDDVVYWSPTQMVD